MVPVVFLYDPCPDPEKCLALCSLVVMRVAWAADVGTGLNGRVVSCRGVS